MATKTKGEPDQAPPVANGDAAAVAAGPGTSVPRPVADDELLEALAPAVAGQPTMAPEEAAAEEDGVQAVAATWRSNQTVTALWSINEVRNAWMHVANLGWRKLYNGRDHAFTALVTLAGQARQTGRPITFREEADGMVYEIYLW